MREVLPDLLRWWRDGASVGVGTVVATWQSAPRQPGASMLVGPEGEAVGSVSGGCVEGAVYELAQEVVESGTPALQRYGVSDEDAYAVGLTCGGILDVWVETVSRETFPELGDVAADIEAGRPVAVATVVEHPDPARLGRRLIVRAEEDLSDRSGSLGSLRLDDAVTDDARGLLASGHSETLTYGPDGERRGEGMRVFVDVARPGAADAGLRGHRLRGGLRPDRQVPRLHGDGMRRPSGVRDGQPVPRRRRGGRRLAAPLPRGRGGGRPDRRVAPSCACSPTTPSSTCRSSRWRCGCPRSPTSVPWDRGAPTRTASSGCIEVGMTDAELARLSSPIGLDLGARTPEETAVSIAAEIIAVRWGGQGSRLADVEGPIHHPTGRHSGPVDLPDSPGSAAEAPKPLQEARPASTI